MSQSTLHQSYTYSAKTAAVSQLDMVQICTDQILFWLVPPDNAITIEYLRTHFIFEFESSVDVADRVIEKIGIVDRFTQNPEGGFAPANHFRTLDLNLAADGNRRVEVNMNLTPLLKKDDVSYDEFQPSIADTGFTFVYVKMPSNLRTNLAVGKIKLWKTDGLFTTTGIR